MDQRHAIPSSNTFGRTLVILTSILLFLSACALIVRMISRHLQRHKPCLNDYLALSAWVFAAGLMTTAVFAVAEGAGKHMRHVNPLNMPKILKGYIAAELTWVAANTTIKCSILHFYLTLFRPKRLFCKFVYGAMGLVVMYGTTVLLSTFLMCRPLAKFWNPLLKGHCGSNTKYVFATSIINVAIDLIIIILPMPMIWNLQMTSNRKLALTATFGIGLIVCVITIIRIALIATLNEIDFSYQLARVAIVTHLEPLLGIIVACLPMFPPTIRKLRGIGQSDGFHRTGSSGRTAFLPYSTNNSGICPQGDSLPLNNIERNTTDVYVGTPVDASRSSDGISIGRGNERMRTLSEIKIEKGWEVNSRVR